MTAPVPATESIENLRGQPTLNLEGMSKPEIKEMASSELAIYRANPQLITDDTFLLFEQIIPYQCAKEYLTAIDVLREQLPAYEGRFEGLRTKILTDNPCARCLAEYFKQREER